jgi:hypothetical protein
MQKPRNFTALMLLSSGLTTLSLPQNEEEFDTVVERPPLTPCALKKSLVLADDFSGVGHSMDRCQKLKHEMEAAMISYYDIQACV